MTRSSNRNKKVVASVACGMIAAQPFALEVYASTDSILDENRQLHDSRTLSYGNHANVVRILQKKLMDLSIYEGNIDGKFGVLTEVSLKEFQKKHHLTVNGKADSHTIQTVIEEEKKQLLSSIGKNQTSITVGDKGEDIKTLQKALSIYGYYDQKIDGIYGPFTEVAIKQYKQDHDLDPDTSLDQSFIQSLRDKAENEKSKAKHIIKSTSKDAKPVKKAITSSQSITTEAKKYIGTPYVWGGNSPGGFDCSGFIQYVFAQKQIKLPRTVREVWNATKSSKKRSVGDLVFFQTYQPGPSHMGIYIGDNQFIHAGSNSGVQISKLSNPYWSSRYIGTKRVHK